MDIGDKLAKRFLIEYQDVSKVTRKYVNELGGKYSTYKTMCKDKEQGYDISANKNPLEQTFAILRDALSHMEEAMVYWSAAEAQSRFNNDFGCGVDALLTGHRSKCVSVMHQFPPLHSIYFL